MAVSLAGVPVQSTELHVSILPAAAELLPGAGMGHLVVVWTPPPPLPQHTLLVGSDDSDLGSRGVCGDRSAPLPITGVVIPGIKSGPGAWREAVRQWEEDKPLLLDALSPKTSGALNRNREKRMKVNIDSGEYLKEYNWGITTNYLSIYMIAHVVTTRLACDAQPSISQLY